MKIKIDYNNRNLEQTIWDILAQALIGKFERIKPTFFRIVLENKKLNNDIEVERQIEILLDRGIYTLEVKIKQLNGEHTNDTHAVLWQEQADIEKQIIAFLRSYFGTGHVEFIVSFEFNQRELESLTRYILMWGEQNVTFIKNFMSLPF